MLVAHEKGRDPVGRAVARKCAQRCGHRRPAQHRIAEEHRDRGAELGGGDLVGGGRAVLRSADGLAHHGQDQQRDDQPRQAHREEGRAPAVVRRHAPAQRRPDGDAEGHAQRVQRQRLAPLLGREVVRDDGVGGRGAPRLADAYAHPRGGELEEVAGQTACGGAEAPAGAGERHDPHPVRAVGEPSNRYAEQGVEQREREARQHADLRVGQVQLLAHRLGQQGQDLPVQEVEGVGQGQYAHAQIAVAQRGGAGIEPRRPYTGGRGVNGHGDGSAAQARAWSLITC